MQGGAIAGVALKAVAREAAGQAADQGIALLFGQHAGGGNGEAAAVASDEGALGFRPAAQGQHPIHQQQLRGGGHSSQGPEHGPFGRQADAQAIDLSGAGLAEGPMQSLAADQGNQLSPAARAELLAVGEAGGGQGGEGGAGKHHRCGEHRTEQSAAAHLIHPHAVGRIMPGPGIGLSRRPRNGGGGGGVHRCHRPRRLLAQMGKRPGARAQQPWRRRRTRP